MIRLPNLDDQTYDDIVETARRRVMQYFPEWTNFNPSDPGVTILELFAWLKEMQQYHLNRVTRGGILACLRLLGMSPDGAVPAGVTAVFRADAPCGIAEGSPFVTDGGLVFETGANISAGVVAVSSVWIDTGGGPAELAGDVYNQGLTIEPFGPGEREGACLYIGFSTPVSPELRLYFDIYDEYPAARSPFGDELEPSRDIEWAYGGEFTVAGNVLDMTRGFSVSGEVSVDIAGEWGASSPAPGMPECYWLRAKLVRRGAEESPKITGFYKDFVKLFQRETFVKSTELTPENGVLTLTDYIGIHGEHIVFAAEGDGYSHVPESSLWRHENRAEIGVKGADEYRVVSVKPGFSALLSTETNLPGIRIEIPVSGHIEKLGLMIEDGGIWREWAYTEQLHTAGPYDRVFTIDGGEVIFGDNEHGACPPAGTGNVLVSDCRVTRGAEGNILPHTPLSARDGVDAPVPDNIASASGGRDPERLEQALARVSALLSARDRCVTREDYEKTAGATPGTRILKTRAIEGYDPKTGGTNIPALVTVVVQPYGAAEHPVPDARLLARVRRHLEKGRLLAARVEVAAPLYIPVSVHAEVAAADAETAKKNIRESLSRFLSPKDGVLGIGSPVLLTEVTAAISKSAGVARVISVALGVPENIASIDRAGNAEIPAHAIVYAGELDIRVSASV